MLLTFEQSIFSLKNEYQLHIKEKKKKIILNYVGHMDCINFAEVELILFGKLIYIKWVCEL